MSWLFKAIPSAWYGTFDRGLLTVSAEQIQEHVVRWAHVRKYADTTYIQPYWGSFGKSSPLAVASSTRPLSPDGQRAIRWATCCTMAVPLKIITRSDDRDLQQQLRLLALQHPAPRFNKKLGID